MYVFYLTPSLSFLFLSSLSPPSPPNPFLSSLTLLSLTLLPLSFIPSLLYTLAQQTWSIPVVNATTALVTMHQQPVSVILFMKGSTVTVSQVSDTFGLTGTA